ncbi:hypothetical protein V5O48_014102 [Marasmius crinis-equi]|uniref:Uncharacterized protein n=1 Tax=Marasmius crinis-equi TaxID=585013 RepID=A0ABR3EYD3_9AGAR
MDPQLMLKIQLRLAREERRAKALKAEQERILTFLRDPLSDPLKLGPNRTACMPCGERVALSKGRFKLEEWEKHKQECIMAVVAQREIDKGRTLAPGWGTATRLEEDVGIDLGERFCQRGLFAPGMRNVFREIGFGYGGRPCTPIPPAAPAERKARSRQSSQSGHPMRLVDDGVKTDATSEIKDPVPRPSTPLPSFTALAKALKSKPLFPKRNSVKPIFPSLNRSQSNSDNSPENTTMPPPSSFHGGHPLTRFNSDSKPASENAYQTPLFRVKSTPDSLDDLSSDSDSSSEASASLSERPSSWKRKIPLFDYKLMKTDSIGLAKTDTI